ncbi:hypothetical protein DB346_01950 [Verrucomicrobia bacterium LW23]|nr:hypothetical protein DB346_01950 [Verrucomicrobia bacterium LW23]
MSSDAHLPNRQLPERANLAHVKDQARDLMQAFAAADPEAAALVRRRLPQRKGKAPHAPLALHEAQLAIARDYGFPSWPRLKAAVEVKTDTLVALRQAIDVEDLAQMRRIIRANPAVIDCYIARESYYYGNHRPLAYASQRIKINAARVLLEAGASIHDDGNLAVARGSMSDRQLPLMEMFLQHGLDVNCNVYGWGPLLTYPAETQAPGMLRLLTAHGADPNLRMPETEARCRDSAWQAVISGYDRSPRFTECVNVLLAAGARHQDGPGYVPPPALDLHRGDLPAFLARLRDDPDIAHQRYPLRGANLALEDTTLLHLCADWNHVEAARALIAAGADINSPAPVNAEGIGGHTPIFHAVNSIFAWAFPMLEFLLEQGADLTVRCSVIHIEKIYRNVTPLSYALQAARAPAERDRAAALLRRYGAME